MIKPSEYTPACGELLREMVHATFDRDRVDVVVGGLELARAFTRVRWDHLLYTGSPAIGREIAKAAAEQLVPVTLELGGKCPAILAEDSVDAESVKQMLATKAIKNGQMCISVDYCLVPRERLEDFAALASRYARESMPGYCESDSCTGIISSRHLERIQALLEDARARGCDVRAARRGGRLRSEAPASCRSSLVIDPPDDLALMQEEIFGPILPIMAYDELDEAIDSVNAGERPLALYVFANDDAVAEDVLRRTTSGGACVNSAAVHGALPSLPFGGIGQSGSGRHHGIEGFREFSNLRGVFVRGEGDLIEAFAPPYGPTRRSGHRRRLRRRCLRRSRSGGSQQRMSHPDPDGPPDLTPIQVGEVFENPATRERATLLELPFSNPDGRARAELTALAGARVAGEHRHPHIVERFTAFQGELTVKRDGQVSILREGDTATIEPNVWHDWWNAGDRDAVVQVEVTPGERFAHMIETLFGLAQLGYTNDKGLPHPLQLALFAQEFDDVIVFRKPPLVVQRGIFGMLAPVARRRGYRATYPQISRTVLAPRTQEPVPRGA